MSVESFCNRVTKMEQKGNMIYLYDNNGLFWSGRADYLSQWKLVYNNGLKIKLHEGINEN